MDGGSITGILPTRMSVSGWFGSCCWGAVCLFFGIRCAGMMGFIFDLVVVAQLGGWIVDR